jgi:hypothetical protein
MSAIRSAQFAKGQTMEHCFFTLENEIFVQGIFDPRRRWNGWACPLLPLSSVVKVAEWLANCEANPADGGVVTIVDGVPQWVEVNDDGYIVPAPIVPTVVDGVEYYDIGAGGWCWSEVEPSEPCDECGAMLVWDDSNDWSHEATPTAGECFTAQRWGLIGEDK